MNKIANQHKDTKGKRFGNGFDLSFLRTGQRVYE